MNLDLRIPMGLLFLIVGAILTVFGALTRGSAIYVHSNGLDINLIWGLVMFVFGAIMFFLGRAGDKRAKGKPVEGTNQPLRGGHGHH
ncbi:hypothetical protein [Acidipila rosea]|uniref:Uncharacterized protein n=1 Tax=Acidipila rosea TaxID=768535 RepID=A0A4R1LBU9_9BACT|nr:hypothetical protein [Acidipila rosea]MBW4026020.1 hypothetical protein [Acidobacteriota bacterium]MBW4044061.1 hypothetical protein [Acidobacteriota bacterium]TCK75966.1 hypothetical protein C7378_0970 [Acidipila rosea]